MEFLNLESDPAELNCVPLHHLESILLASGKGLVLDDSPYSIHVILKVLICQAFGMVHIVGALLVN